MKHCLPRFDIGCDCPRTPQAPSPPRCGFTLIEMVAAVVLMGILFVSLTSLLRSFSRQQRTIQQISDQLPPTYLLSKMLRRDLLAAQLIGSTRASLRLAGTMAQASQSKMPIGQRAEVTYRVATLNGESWLLRREVHLDNNSSSRSHEEPVWRGVASIELVVVDESSIEQTNGPTIAGMRPAAPRMRLILRRDDATPLLAVHVLHHWEDN